MYQIKVDGQVLYSPALSDEYQVISPHLKRAFNKADKLTFILPPTNAMHGKIQKMKHTITAEWNGKEIFRGRVLEEKTDLYNQTAVICEGELAYLVDSLLRPYEFEGTAEAFLRLMIEKHNAQVDAGKRFTVGIVTAVTADDTLDIENTGYTDTLSEINNLLLDKYSGYLHIRHENDVRYLDYIKEYNEESNQKIEFGVNLLDIENHINAQELFTVLVPLSEFEDGSETLTIEKVNNGLDYIENPEAIARYGRIVKRYVWHNVQDAQKLLELGQEKLNNAGTLDTLTVKAVDMHLCNVDIDTIDLGVTAHVLSKPHGIDKMLLCSAVDIDLQDPDKTEYTFGKPEESIAGSVASNTKRNKSQLNHIKQTEHAVLINIQKIDEALQRLSAVTFEIDAAKNEILLRAEKTTVDALTNRVSKAEASITIHAEEITNKVSKDGVVSAINQTPEAVTISAGKINLSGYVTASQLNAEVANINKLLSGSATISYLNVSSLTLGGTYISSLRFHNVTIDGTKYQLLGAP